MAISERNNGIMEALNKCHEHSKVLKKMVSDVQAEIRTNDHLITKVLIELEKADDNEI